MRAHLPLYYVCRPGCGWHNSYSIGTLQSQDEISSMHAYYDDLCVCAVCHDYLLVFAKLLYRWGFAQVLWRWDIKTFFSKGLEWGRNSCPQWIRANWRSAWKWEIRGHSFLQTRILGSDKKMVLHELCEHRTLHCHFGLFSYQKAHNPPRVLPMPRRRHSLGTSQRQRLRCCLLHHAHHDGPQLRSPVRTRLLQHPSLAWFLQAWHQGWTDQGKDQGLAGARCCWEVDGWCWQREWSLCWIEYREMKLNSNIS